MAALTKKMENMDGGRKSSPAVSSVYAHTTSPTCRDSYVLLGRFCLSRKDKLPRRRTFFQLFLKIFGGM